MWKELFDEWTLIKGGAIPDSCILDFSVDDHEIKAKVKGTEIYDVRIDKHINMSCSCPQGSNCGRCKHLACVLLMHDKRGDNGGPKLEFDYSRQKEHLAELINKGQVYKAKQAEYWKQRAIEKERAKQERARIKAEELAERKRKREEEARLESERIAKEREEQRRMKFELEEKERRRKLIDKLSILGIEQLEDYSTEQLKSMCQEFKSEIATKRIALEKAEKERKKIEQQERIRITQEKEERRKANERRKYEPKVVDGVIRLIVGNKIYVSTIGSLVYELFNYTNIYRSYYFKPKEAQKYIRGGFYILVIKDIDGGWVHDLKNGQVWKTTISESRDQIERKYIGEDSALTDEIMDKHGRKILVFLDERKNEQAFEFFGVFGEQQVLFLHNCFKGISYIKLSDSIEYEVFDI